MKIFGSSKDFIKGNDIEWEIVGKGLKRKIMGYDDKIMLVKVFFDKGAVGELHKHHHSQVTYVESGSFDVTISGQTKTLVCGDSSSKPTMYAALAAATAACSFARLAPISAK